MLLPPLLVMSLPAVLASEAGRESPVAPPLAASVRSITLPHFEPDLAVAPGRDEFLAVCVSCHSARYVTMQPPFSERQWQENVDKMVKVYGAPVGEDQRQAIVGYLVAIHGPGTKPIALPPDDEDWASTRPAQPAPRPEPPAPFLKLATAAVENASEATRGAGLFQQNCAACHGTMGKGDGFVSHVLLRKPKDLAANRFSRRLLSQVLWNGKPGTAMPSWRSLPQTDLAALAAYVRGLHPPARPLTASAGVLRQGNQLFQQNCAPCHGAAGDGKGPVAVTLLPAPANFRLKQPDTDYVLAVLQDGIQGTAMPSWKDQLSAPDRQAVADFVRSLFDEPSADNTP